LAKSSEWSMSKENLGRPTQQVCCHFDRSFCRIIVQENSLLRSAGIFRQEGQDC